MGPSRLIGPTPLSKDWLSNHYFLRNNFFTDKKGDYSVVLKVTFYELNTGKLKIRMNKSLPCTEVNVMLSFGSRGGGVVLVVYIFPHIYLDRKRFP